MYPSLKEEAYDLIEKLADRAGFDGRVPITLAKSATIDHSDIFADAIDDACEGLQSYARVHDLIRAVTEAVTAHADA